MVLIILVVARLDSGLEQVKIEVDGVYSVIVRSGLGRRGDLLKGRIRASRCMLPLLKKI